MRTQDRQKPVLVAGGRNARQYQQGQGGSLTGDPQNLLPRECPIKVNPNSENYLIDGGTGSMVAAASMIRDGGVPGGNICILEAAPLRGGSLDGAGNAQQGYL